jgi:DNA polymerase-3 subunit gamma/tau
MSDADIKSGPPGNSGLQAPTAQESRQDPGGGYRVLARKYRPSTFDDLIGQEAMVRTVSNAFETGRIPQAWILTGVRGVGKTTTARILARALNYELPDGSVPGPRIKMPELGVHCRAIMESRHLDVLEMDAASHNSVDDVRQINDAVRYAPVSARYKVYILDEVHMLSGAAFNALLKTLEEPPPHAKFVFATTEIRKVPVTVLSRCQRFDLRRVDASVLVQHLEGIGSQEGIAIEPAALSLIARASEGSVRDALSLLDQAIAHSGAQSGAGLNNNSAGPVRAEDVRRMLGLADRSRTVDLFESLMKGDVAAALNELRDQYDSGADPSVVLNELAEFTHFVTRVKIVPSVADDVSLSEAERGRGREFAAKLSMRVLSRTWQMLLKGLAEVQNASRPVAAAEMVLVRIAYVADLPTPDEVIRSLSDGGSVPARVAPSNGSQAGPSATAGPSPSAAPRFDAQRGGGGNAMRAPQPATQTEPQASVTPVAAGEPTLSVGSFPELIALAADKRDIAVKMALERDVRLVRYEEGRLEISLEPSAQRALVNDLSRKLSLWTGKRWMVIVSAEAGAPTVHSQSNIRKAAFEQEVTADPLVQAVLMRFPGAKIVEVRPPAAMLPAEGLASIGEEGDVLPDEPPPVDDESAYGGVRPEDNDDF